MRTAHSGAGREASGGRGARASAGAVPHANADREEAAGVTDGAEDDERGSTVTDDPTPLALPFIVYGMPIEV